MCKVCEQALRASKKDALAAIGKAMAAGKKAEHFVAVLDQILGTQTPDDDKELDTAWENSKR
jgi:hypothetical protein